MLESFDRTASLHTSMFLAGLLLIAGALFGGIWDHLLLICAVVLVATHLWLAVRHWWIQKSSGSHVDEFGIHDQRYLKTAIESELARSRRFGHEFALVITAPQSMGLPVGAGHSVGSYPEVLSTTARLLGSTRFGVDRVFRYGRDGFAILAAESGPDAVNGMIRRLRRAAKRTSPGEGEPGGPLPLVYGASFYPTRATSAESLLARAEVALKLAHHSPSRAHLDGAEAPEEANPQTLRVSPEVLGETLEEQLSA